MGEAWKRSVRVSAPVMGTVVDYETPIIAERWWAPAITRSRKNCVKPQMAAQLSQ